MNNSTATSALILITVALAGAGVSYHFTLESRFAAIEQKLDQNSLALQQYQIAQDTIFSSKTEALNNLSKEVDALQASIGPLGKATQVQTDSLADLRKQIASLQQSQSVQEDAQKKLSDYANQLEKIKHEVQVQATAAPVTPVPVQTTPPAAATPASASSPAAPASTPPHVSLNVPLPLPPRADNTEDLRPASLTNAPVRAYPIAIPVAITEASR